MKEKSIAKTLSAEKLSKIRGGRTNSVIYPPPITYVVSTPGHGRGCDQRRYGKFGPIRDEDCGTADA